MGRLVSGHRPPTFAGEEDPVVLEEWMRVFDKIFSVVGCPEERRVELATFYFCHEADLWWIHEGLAYLEEPEFDWSARKDRMRERFYPAHVRAAMYEEFLHLQQGSLPSSLKDAYLSAADLYRVQQLQRGSYELARKMTESGSSSTFRSFQVKNASSPTQRPNRMEQGNQAKAFPCRRCGKVHVGQVCHSQAFKCFRCGERGHKVAECRQQANQRALPPPPGAGGAAGSSSSCGAAGARPSGRVFVMGRSQAETEGLMEEELAV
ncbi:PREDICTED: uncharacterized protein LOC109170904 [Ipomoea nil]|uniref:uncharacterized protein LOC109170904 n=1 Tax=Ipomoea nil TaxID=35883 RepID=UPI0009014B37|nr:PREDICTED: uncharacterized protein LOC109170904 [Ipomoea nil]